MFRLFSSFDYFCLGFPKLIEISFLSTVFISLYKFTFVKKIFGIFLSFFNGFTRSLSLSGYKKRVVFLFITIIIFLLVLNLSSVFPFNFAHTSQISLVLGFGFGLWLRIIIFSNVKNSKGFLSHAVPVGTPSVLVPFLFLIELISNIIRPITLTVRLVANILAGHLLLILLSKVVYYSFSTIPFYFLLNFVEFFVALIQSYIFVTMITLYYCELD